ncbi:425_t:CDS:1, partial [Funneliformis mosseae]
LSFLESLSSRPSSVSSTKKSQRNSEMFLDDFLDIQRQHLLIIIIEWIVYNTN